MATTQTPAGIEPKLQQARERLDQHVREIVAWHFDPETGCPFWLERAAHARLGPAPGSPQASTI